ncbi:kinase-like protein [Rhizophagus irregularis]|nr:kinase-like protein [Rhizophagus irregularis]
MELVNTNDENSFDPTPRLKSSPVPIKFISFNEKDIYCIYCREEYIETLLCRKQRYCKKCLSLYISYITDDNIYLDVYICTIDLEFNLSRKRVSRNIQECYENNSRILCFKQINGYIKDLYFNINDFKIYNKVIKSEKYCKLCGKSFYHGTDRLNMEQNKLKLCSDCYLISSGWIVSTLINKQISILYLPWWHNVYQCNACYSTLIFISDCQKYCENCFIFYTGCRYCLTTNVIFGPTGQSQCRKCKRISLISEFSGFDDFIYSNIIYDNLSKLKLTEFAKSLKMIDKYFEPFIIDLTFEKRYDREQIKWIPYSQFTNINEIARGGFGIIYKAIWSSENETVILKRFENSKNIEKYFLNELKSYQHCSNSRIIEIYGFTKDPKLKDYILIMRYASDGDLHKYLQKNFTSIKWNKQKLHILWQISEGLETIHNKKFMHRDFHSGNILFDSTNNNYDKNYQWKIGDLGLSQAVNNKSSNHEIYGVIPYIAPEIFEGSEFSQESDIYSFSMIMWELTTGCKPFSNIKHDVQLICKILDGLRPKITEDTPKCYANLMKKCWDPNPKKRPSIKKIRLTFGGWAFKGKNEAKFIQAETKRMELITSKTIGPEFAEKHHSEAIYTSRLLNSFISEYSSINLSLSSTISISNSKQGYDHNYISTEQDFDIDIESSLPSQNLSLSIQNSLSIY